MRSTPRLVLPILCCLTGLLSAADGAFATELTLNLWRLKPSEVVEEINLRLPPYQRLAWYVNANTDGLVYPGPMLTCKDQTVAEIIGAYCEACEEPLAYSTTSRGVWIYRPAPADSVESWKQALTDGGSETAREKAILGILDQPSPKGVRQLLVGLTAKNAATRRACYRALARLLGASRRGFESQARMCRDIFSGDLPHLYRPIATMDEYGEAVPAPWVWARIALKDQQARTALEHAVADADLTRDLPLLVLACAAKLPAAKPALKQRAEKDIDRHGGWVQNWVKGYAKRILRWLEDDGAAEPVSPADYAKQAEEARAAIIGPEVLEELKALQPKADRLKREYQRLKKADEDKETIKAAEKAYKEVAERISHLEKQLNKRDKVNVNQIDRLVSAHGEPAIGVLMDLITATDYYVGLRQLALDKARRQLRSPAMVPGLTTILIEDKAPQLKMMAGRLLGLLRVEGGLEVLRREIDNPDSMAIRKAAAVGMALSHATDAAGLIKARLEAAKNSEERQFMLQALGWTRDPEAVEFLLEVSSSEETVQERIAAIYGLSVMENARVKQMLVDVINDTRRSLMLRTAAVEGLKPKNGQEAQRYLPILLDTLPSQTNEKLSVTIINAIWTGAKYLNSGADLKRELGTRCAQMVADKQIPTRVRMHLLNLFKHTDNTAEAIAILEEVLAGEESPISRRFLKIAVANAKKNQVE